MTPLTQGMAGTGAHWQGPASLARGLAWYALVRTGADASRGQGGMAGGWIYMGLHHSTWTLKTPTICTQCRRSQSGWEAGLTPKRFAGGEVTITNHVLPAVAS